MSEKTLGEKRIRTDFNASNSDVISKVKNDFASMIDGLDGFKISKNHLPEEQRAEINRLVATAQTKIEEAAMWTVKALTS